MKLSRQFRELKKLRATVKVLMGELEIFRAGNRQASELVTKWRSKAESYELDLVEARRLLEAESRRYEQAQSSQKSYETHYDELLGERNRLRAQLLERELAFDNLYLDFEKARQKLAIIEILVAKPPYPRRTEEQKQ